MNADVEKAVERVIGYMDAVLSEYPRGEADWQTILAALRDAEPDAAWAHAYYELGGVARPEHVDAAIDDAMKGVGK